MRVGHVLTAARSRRLADGFYQMLSRGDTDQEESEVE